ncbi:MAG: class II aldolase/adducin family protein [candidate division WOR-3 bacterium]
MKNEQLNQIKQEIIKLAKFIYTGKYVVATDGNISVRIDSQTMLITKKNVCKGEIGLKDVILVSLKSYQRYFSKLTPQPSSEYQMHQEIYKNRDDIKVVIHAHPLYATLIGITGIKLKVNLLAEIEKFIGPVGIVGYYEPGSVQLADAVARKARECNSIILKRHGVVVMGIDALETRYRLERLERFAEILFLYNLATNSK